VEEELAIVENTRRQMARILRKQPAEALARTGTTTNAARRPWNNYSGARSITSTIT
jgi:hypothetical protein